MNFSEEVKIVSQHYMCDCSLAEKIIKSAELNSRKKEIERIIQNETEANKNANNSL